MTVEVFHKVVEFVVSGVKGYPIKGEVTSKPTSDEFKDVVNYHRLIRDPFDEEKVLIKQLVGTFNKKAEETYPKFRVFVMNGGNIVELRKICKEGGTVVIANHIDLGLYKGDERVHVFSPSFEVEDGDLRVRLIRELRGLDEVEDDVTKLLETTI